MSKQTSVESLESIHAYARAAVALASVEEIEPQHWFAEAKGLPGVWGDGVSKSEALADFEQAVVSWVEMKLQRGVDVLSIIEDAEIAQLVRERTAAGAATPLVKSTEKLGIDLTAL